jgi:S-adenosylmethionine uptake transporter
MQQLAEAETQRRTMHGVTISFLAYSTYALSDASVRMLHGTLPPFELVFFGSLIGLLAVPSMREEGDRWRGLVTCRDRRMWVICGGAATVAAVCSAVAFTLLPMTEAFALIFLLPAFVTILSVIFLKESISWRRWAAVATGFFGVMIVLRPGFHAVALGHVAALGGGFAAAVMIVALRYLGNSERRLSLYGAVLIGPLVIGLLLSLPYFVVPTTGDTVFIVSYGLLYAAGNVLMMVASRMAPASLVAPAQYSQMLWGIGLGYALFGDKLDRPMILGAAVIIAAGLYTFVSENAKHS